MNAINKIVGVSLGILRLCFVVIQSLKHTKADFIEASVRKKGHARDICNDLRRLCCAGKRTVIDTLQSELCAASSGSLCLHDTSIIERNIIGSLKTTLNIPISQAMTNEEDEHKRLPKMEYNKIIIAEDGRYLKQ